MRPGVAPPPSAPAATAAAAKKPQIAVMQRFPEGLVAYQSYGAHAQCSLDDELTGIPVKLDDIFRRRRIVVLGFPGAL